ncbi:hypothetical protein [Paenibacillus amylolyticus]|uniref:hypothetical protein n=1 Tax=Paenibacillus amylolyticus TaxID=1451 RepID=UPI003EB70A1F
MYIMVNKETNVVIVQNFTDAQVPENTDDYMFVEMKEIPQPENLERKVPTAMYTEGNGFFYQYDELPESLDSLNPEIAISNLMKRADEADYKNSLLLDEINELKILIMDLKMKSEVV